MVITLLLVALTMLVTLWLSINLEQPFYVGTTRIVFSRIYTDNYFLHLISRSGRFSVAVSKNADDLTTPDFKGNRWVGELQIHQVPADAKYFTVGNYTLFF